MAMKNYDPNIRYGIHTIRITLQQWGYVGHITKKVGGNCKGIDVMDIDFECEDEDTLRDNDCNLRFDEDGYIFATLKDEEGSTLDIVDEAREFNKMVVAIEIVDYVKEG